MESRAEISILVVDDEPTITEFLATGLTYEGYRVHVAEDGSEALRMARELRPDLVILDIMLPGCDGFEVCRRLRSASDVAIIMLTARDDLDDKVQGLEDGADDYLVKPFKFRELLARVRALLRRRRITLPNVVQIDHLRLDREARELTSRGQIVHLTPIEFELLETLMTHPRQVLSKETLLNRVWGYSYIGDSNVVEVHISALREKIGDDDRQIIQTVRGVGYVLRGA
jgi:DNA-binding response OmpR family regulator